jgi:hypothetical protein
VIAAAVEGHQHEPAEPDQEHRDHPELVPALLLLLKQRTEPLPEKIRVVPGEPRPAREAHDGKEAEIDPRGRPADGAGSAEQHDGEKDDPHRGADDEFPQEIGRNAGDGGHGPLEAADRGFTMT